MGGERSSSQPQESLEVQSWYETAKKARVDSLATGREFSRSMISLCAGGIPVYLGLLKLVLPEGYTFSSWNGLLVVLPAILFLVGIVVFALAFYPPSRGVSFDDYFETVEFLSFLMRRRQRLNVAGLVVFVLGNALGILVIVLHL
jgi:hypothetical protein